MAPALLLAAMLLASLQPGAATAAGYGKNKVQVRQLEWQTLTTPHFEIHFYDGAEELAVRASIIAEQAYQEYAARLDRDLPWRVPFILYSSHNDFAQTNISDALIGEGTGGFSEPFRNRMVLPYNGSHAEFVHVIRHELVHVFMFDMAFGRRGGNVGRSYLFNIPLWFAEGIAEWLSAGWDKEADMFMRDAAINDYLYPLDRVGGFLVYKEGQAAMRLLGERYGSEKLIDFWRAIGRVRSVERALGLVYGLSVEDLNELFLKTLRQRYWPSYGNLEELEDIARPLTDHIEEGAFFNESAAISPDGDLVAFLSDREGLIDLYLMSAIDGQILRRLARGHRSSTYESFHTRRSGISFDPTGTQIAVVAKSGNRETLHLIDVNEGRERRSFALDFDVVSWPSWSPDGETIALTGTRLGRTDLYLLDLDGECAAPLTAVFGEGEALPGGGRLLRLTDDIGDESMPAWSPDSRRLAFAFNPAAEIEFEFEIDGDGTKRLLWARPVTELANGSARTAPAGNIMLLDLDSGRRASLFAQEGSTANPVWLDDSSLCLIADHEGIDNLAFVRLDTTGTQVRERRFLTNVLGGLSNLSYSGAADRLLFTGFSGAGYDVYAVENFRSQWSQREPAGDPPGPITLEPPPIVTRQSPPDSVIAPERVGLIEAYRPRFTLDTSQALGGGGVYFNSGVGLGMANMIHLSDLMGDRRMSFLLNFYSSFENSDISVSYYSLKRRFDYGVGVFHYSNYYNSIMTSVGELLSDQTFFRERNYGLFGLISYPRNTFQRFDLEMQLLTSDRTNYDYGDGLYLVEGDRRLSRLVQPTLSYVSDSALYGNFGPIAGGRWTLSLSQAVPLSSSSLQRTTTVFDWRKYWLPWRRNSFAIHLTAAYSGGNDPRAFLLGGPWTLRGYDYFDYRQVTHLAGPRLLLASFEYRLPLVDYLIFGWPFQWGLTNVGATMFFDMGTAWHDKVQLFGHDEHDDWGFRDLRGDWGLGIRTRVGFLPLKFDWGWKTDLRRSQSAIFQFSIGPEF